MANDILIVDDNPNNLKILAEIFKNEEFKVRLIRDSTLVISSVDSSLPDLILLDIMMPKMDGFEVCKKLKSNPKTKEIPIIFISALQDVNDKIRAFDEGGVDYITKPFESREVIARVKTHLKIISLQKELQKSNEGLKQKVEEEVLKRRRQEEMLIQQSKMAAMGEMVGAIAHQWLQPLSTLGLIIQDIELKYESEEIDSKYIDKLITDSLFQIDFMTQTVNTFRNFLKPSKEKVTFEVIEAIEDVIHLISAQLKQHQIKLSINYYKDKKLYSNGYPNEFKQVILNLLNNARDALEVDKKDVNIKNIIIEVYEKENYIFIDIVDNNGGIDLEIIDKIFDPYVSTKGEAGTGIGLYMSKSIIEDNMDGKIYAQNLKESGAKFTIKLPVIKNL